METPPDWASRLTRGAEPARLPELLHELGPCVPTKQAASTHPPTHRVYWRGSSGSCQVPPVADEEDAAGPHEEGVAVHASPECASGEAGTGRRRAGFGREPPGPGLPHYLLGEAFMGGVQANPWRPQEVM